MKVVNYNQRNERKPKPILPIIDEADDKNPPKTKIQSYDLLTDPDDKDSPKYRMTVRILDGTETLRATLLWRQNIPRVLEGLGMRELPLKQSGVIKQLLKGTAHALSLTVV